MAELVVVEVMVQGEEVMVARSGQRVLMSVVGGMLPFCAVSFSCFVAMQVRDPDPVAASSALQKCSFLSSSRVLPFRLDNFAPSTEEPNNSNTIEGDFGGRDGYE
jgi:hypothetical protein